MTGFAVYGIHRDGTALDPDELETLSHLCDAAAQAYTYIEVRQYRTERSAVSLSLRNGTTALDERAGASSSENLRDE
jgi:hypothetical protein